MHYLISVIHERSAPDSPNDEAAIDEINQRLQAGGDWVFADGSSDQ